MHAIISLVDGKKVLPIGQSPVCVLANRATALTAIAAGPYNPPHFVAAFRNCRLRFFVKRPAMPRITFAPCGAMRTLFVWQGRLSDLYG
jgi:hypothetical protein